MLLLNCEMLDRVNIGWNPELVLFAVVLPNSTNLAVVLPNSTNLAVVVSHSSVFGTLYAL